MSTQVFKIPFISVEETCIALWRAQLILSLDKDA